MIYFIQFHSLSRAQLDFRDFLAPLVKKEREDLVESLVVLDPVDPLESVYVCPSLLLTMSNFTMIVVLFVCLIEAHLSLYHHHLPFSWRCPC